MKSFQLAAAGMLSLFSVAQAQSLCAVNCFQSVIAEHPPLSCTEESMYLCFCKSTSLQGYFIDCAYDECASEAEAAVAFGVNICSELGAPITVPARPTTTTTAAAQETEPTSQPPSTVSESEQTSAAAVESKTSTKVEVVSSSAPSAESYYSAPSDLSSAEPTYAEPSKSEAAPTQVGNMTTPAFNEPTHVVVNAGMNVVVAPGLITSVAAAIAAFQLL
jgi:hypothetical protein